MPLSGGGTPMSSGWPNADQVFILRFWKEEVEAGQELQWRVQVKNVNTRRRHVVDDVNRAFAIVMARLNAATDNDIEADEQCLDQF